MKVTNIEERLSEIDPSQRILLIAQCLRPSKTCPGKFDKKGLICPEDCSVDCVPKRFSEVALNLGYKGVCIAAGGAMVLRFVKEHSSQVIVAVACEKELAAGVDDVKVMVKDEQEAPVIMTIPLLLDGCVDTEVDVERVLKAIRLGC